MRAKGLYLRPQTPGARSARLAFAAQRSRWLRGYVGGAGRCAAGFEARISDLLEGGFAGRAPDAYANPRRA